jgi:uncharacterized protein
MLDLSRIPLTDVHCHPLSTEYASVTRVADLQGLVALGATGTAPYPAFDVEHSFFWQYLLRHLSRYLGCEPTSAAVAAARHAAAAPDYAAYTARLFADAGMRHLVVDRGFPVKATLQMSQFQALVPQVGMTEIVRIEWIRGLLTPLHDRFDTFVKAFLDDLKGRIDAGCKGFKSIIAYRTGLAVEENPDRDAAARGWDEVRRDPARESKVLNDYLFMRAFELARDLKVPFQIHTGWGARRIVLRYADPRYLHPFIDREWARDVTTILVHGGYPWMGSAATMAALYPHVYVDVSETIPFIHARSGARLLEILEAAPYSKIVFGTDGFNIPEVYWIGAIAARQAVSEAMTWAYDAGILDEPTAQRAAAMILDENARRLYGIPG